MCPEFADSELFLGEQGQAGTLVPPGLPIHATHPRPPMLQLLSRVPLPRAPPCLPPPVLASGATTEAASQQVEIQPLLTHLAWLVQGATWAQPPCTCCTAPLACRAPSRWCRACTWGALRLPGLLSRMAAWIPPASGALLAALPACCASGKAARLGFGG